MEKDIEKIMEAGTMLYTVLGSMPCVCERQFKYHGKGVTMCRRCRALSMWEAENSLDQTTQKTFDTYKP